MAHEMKMGDDGILRIMLLGDVGREEAIAFTGDYQAFLAPVTEKEPLFALVDVSQAGNVSAAARKILTEMNRDPRIGKTAVLGANRYLRVMAGFVLKAAGRDNFSFWGSEEEALAWLKAERKGKKPK